MNEGGSRVEAVIAPEMSGWRLDRALATLIPTMSRERLKGLISSGAVLSGDVATRDPATKIKPGTT